MVRCIRPGRLVPDSDAPGLSSQIIRQTSRLHYYLSLPQARIIFLRLSMLKSPPASLRDRPTLPPQPPARPTTSQNGCENFPKSSKDRLFPSCAGLPPPGWRDRRPTSQSANNRWRTDPFPPGWRLARDRKPKTSNTTGRTCLFIPLQGASHSQCALCMTPHAPQCARPTVWLDPCQISSYETMPACTDRPCILLLIVPKTGCQPPISRFFAENLSFPATTPLLHANRSAPRPHATADLAVSYCRAVGASRRCTFSSITPKFCSCRMIVCCKAANSRFAV